MNCELVHVMFVDISVLVDLMMVIVLYIYCL